LATYLEVGFDSSQNFLRAWQAWLADPQRPAMLHFVAICGDAYQNTFADPELKPLADQLDEQLWGLLPGFHRLVFEGGRVLLTLCVGDVLSVLKQQQFAADAVFLNPLNGTALDTLHTVKTIARLCKSGTRLESTRSDAALQAALSQCGFEASDALHATYNPSWARKHRHTAPVKPGTCVVVGAGLAGAAVASSLARRGWQVTVLDAAEQPASGASSLPAGLLVAHTSPDDSPLSRLSRGGIRITLQQARAHLRHGTDWGQTGVLQRSLDGEVLNLPAAWTQNQSQSQVQAASDWCHTATPRTLLAAGLAADSHAVWHAQAGWIKPAALVHAWLATPGISWRGGTAAARLACSDGGWEVQDAACRVLARADLVILAAAFENTALAATTGIAPPDLQALRGQVTFGLQQDSNKLPPFAVNGHGTLITAITTADGPMWLMGASYERDMQEAVIKAQDHTDNLARLQRLLPEVAVTLSGDFDPQNARGWAGIRCATPSHLPLVGPLSSAGQSEGLWICTGMGSRGLSFAALCGELLAARLHGEPLPIDSKMASAMSFDTN
jgi:tRNA 5-methylaminomethyl-2-thiouridine biosynthesis bifunctional protein